jgi:vacuolar protein sorting-associated protein 29
MLNSFEAFESDGRFFLNPGSATGAFSPFWTPSPSTSAAPAPTEEGEGEGEKKEEKEEKEKEGEKEDGNEEEEEEEEGPTPSFALLDIQGNVVVTCVSFLLSVSSQRTDEELRFVVPAT